MIELTGANADSSYGLSLAATASNSIIRGLAINRFPGAGIVVLGNGNVISANYIGTDPAGTTDLGNSGNGIQIIDGANNTIGGGSAADRNIISGNGGEGIRIDGALSIGNMIRGNFIGTTAAGDDDLGNGLSGVYIRKAPGNSVIQNVISGNDGFAGVAICGGPNGGIAQCGGGVAGAQTSNATGNIVQGNLIGTNGNLAAANTQSACALQPAGTCPIGNSQRGVSIDGAPNTLVGGPLAGDRNVISATEAGPGIVIFNPGATSNLIRGNIIGADITGAVPLANHGDGVLLLSGANANIISGKETDRTAPNTIKFNTGMGIDVQAGQHEFRINRIDANGGLGISGGESA